MFIQLQNWSQWASPVLVNSMLRGRKLFLLPQDPGNLTKYWKVGSKWQFVTTVILFTIYTIRHRTVPKTVNVSLKELSCKWYYVFFNLYNVAWLEFDRRHWDGIHYWNIWRVPLRKDSTVSHTLCYLPSKM